MFGFLKSEKFNVFFSFVLGIAIVSLFKTPCKDDCRIKRAPSVDEIRNTTYQLGSKCYKFSTQPAECLQTGMIESFFQRENAIQREAFTRMNAI
jgi:hypothetical protein